MCSWVVPFSVFSCLRWGLKQLEIERRDGDSEEEAPEEVAQARCGFGETETEREREEASK